MIGVEGQYLLSFSIGGLSDFLEEEDVIDFFLIEDAGNVLPTFELKFTARLPLVISKFNEGNVLSISFGVTKDAMVTSRLIIFRVNLSRAGKGAYTLVVRGTYDAVAYISDPKMVIHDELSAIETIIAIVSEHFTPDIEPLISDDKQYWIQPSTTDKKMVSDLWLRTELPESFPLVGITSDGIFRLRDAKIEAGKEPAFVFSYDPQGSNEVGIDGDYSVDSNSGFLNLWLGYGHDKLIYMLEEGEFERITEDSDTILALAKNLNRKSSTEKRIAQIGTLGENVHEKYWSAYMRNMMNLALFSSTKMTVSFTNVLLPIKVLDLVMVKDDKPNREEAADFYSGLYFVSKVSRSFGAKQFITVVEVCRECFSDTQGDLR